MSKVSARARKQGYSEERIKQIELAMEEALVNVCRYAYPGACGDVEVLCRKADDKIVVDIIDTGVPFNPESVPDPELGSSSVCSRNLGGLGCFLIRKMVDEIHYRRENNKNILTLVLGGHAKSAKRDQAYSESRGNHVG